MITLVSMTYRDGQEGQGGPKQAHGAPESNCEDQLPPSRLVWRRTVTFDVVSSICLQVLVGR